MSEHVLEPEELFSIEAEIMGEGEGFNENAGGNGNKQTEGVFMGAKAMGKLLEKSFSIAARLSGKKNINLLPDEVEELGEVIDVVAAKYLPSFLDKYGKEVTAAIALGGVAARMYAENAESDNG